MARIGILNFPGHMNQGANLTSYALQKLLQDWGHDAVNLHLHDNYVLYKNPKYTDFADANIRMTRQSAAGPLSMQLFNKHFDTFIVGSDQVWRYADNDMFEWKTCIEPCFHLSFAAPGKKRIAVAASFGRADYTADIEVRKDFAQELCRFTAISVREHSGVGILKELGNFESSILIDPVFYIEASIWHGFAATKSEYEHPRLAYNSFYYRGNIEKLQAAMSGEFDFVDVCEGNTAQWLASIRDARFVITDSYHVCCFCLIFGTPFACLSNAGFGRTRFEELAETFAFSTTRIIDPSAEPDLEAAIRRVMQLPYDNSTVQQAIEAGRSKAHTWLRTALQAPVPEWKGPSFVPASRKEINTELRSDRRWLRRYYSIRNLTIINFLLRVSPFFRKKLQAKKQGHEQLLQTYSW